MAKNTFTANFEYYKVFYYAARFGSFTTAAERLFLTQPSVTKAIHRLEQQLGCSLFMRTKRGVALTPEGTSLWRHVEPACRMLLAGESELESMRELDIGEVRVASTEMSLKTYVLPALTRFTQDYPHVKIRFHNALTPKILEMLTNQEVDIAILHTPFHLGEGLAARELDHMRECFVAGRRFSELGERENELSDLLGYPFISMPEGSSTKEYTSGFFRAHGHDFEPDIEVTTIELAIQAVVSDLGIGVLPLRIVSDRIERGELVRVRLREEPPERGAYIITNQRAPMSAAAGTFLESYLAPRPADAAEADGGE